MAKVIEIQGRVINAKKVSFLDKPILSEKSNGNEHFRTANFYGSFGLIVDGVQKEMVYKYTFTLKSESTEDVGLYAGDYESFRKEFFAEYRKRFNVFQQKIESDWQNIKKAMELCQ